jgi:hypothetical protein
MNVSSQKDDKKRLMDHFEVLAYKDKVWKKVRFIGETYAYAEAWIKIKTKTGKIVSIPKYSRDLNPETGEWEDNGCPYRAAGVNFRVVYLCNAIDRAEQDNEPRKRKEASKEEKALGFKVMNSETWTPVRVAKVPSSVAQALQGYSETNTKTNKKTGETKAYDISHQKFGRDIQIKYNKDASSPANTYQVDKMERTPLSDDEKEYLGWDIVSAIRDMWETKKDAQREWEKLSQQLVDGENQKKAEEPLELDEDDAIDLEDMDEAPKKKKKKKKNKKHHNDD